MKFHLLIAAQTTVSLKQKQIKLMCINGTQHVKWEMILIFHFSPTWIHC